MMMSSCEPMDADEKELLSSRWCVFKLNKPACGPESYSAPQMPSESGKTFGTSYTWGAPPFSFAVGRIKHPSKSQRLWLLNISCGKV